MTRRNAMTAAVSVLVGVGAALGYRSLTVERQTVVAVGAGAEDGPRIVVAARSDGSGARTTEQLVMPTRDPKSSDYDPVTLAQVLEVPVVDVIAAEPRDAAWADRIERLYRTRIAGDLAEDFPELEIDRVECRTSSCELELSGPDAVAGEAYDYAQQFLPMGNLFEPTLRGSPGDERRTMVFRFLVSAQLRSADEYEDWYQRVRDSREGRLAAYRQQRSER